MAIPAATESRMSTAAESTPSGTLPTRTLPPPELEAPGFQVYQTETMFLAWHRTSQLPAEAQWPGNCLHIGWERYYSGAWDEQDWHVPSGSGQPFERVPLHPAAAGLHYGVSIFEGTKAIRSALGNIVLFRPEANARRLQDSAARLLMPKVPLPLFMQALQRVALANRSAIPDYSNATWAWETRAPRCLYIRPMLCSHDAQIGVRPGLDHLFVTYATPVRAYYPVEGIRVLASTHFHRAAPGGVGHVKAAANYAPGMLASQLAARGYDWIDGRPVKISDTPFDDVLYLDAVENKYVEEFSGANFLAVSADGTLICPESESILPGITRDSVLQLAKRMGIPVQRRKLSIEEVMDPAATVEAFCTGNAAIITPILSVSSSAGARIFETHRDSLAQAFWDELVGIQLEIREDHFGWVQRLAE